MRKYQQFPTNCLILQVASNVPTQNKISSHTIICTLIKLEHITSPRTRTVPLEQVWVWMELLCLGYVFEHKTESTSQWWNQSVVVSIIQERMWVIF